jgi:hypothetical protein
MLIAVVTITATCAAQTAHPRETPKTQPARSAFVCPDPEVVKACKSYEELLKAKDVGLLTDAYVCFRTGVAIAGIGAPSNEDEFFVVAFSIPRFRQRRDKDSKQMVPDTEATYAGFGNIHTYKDGIEDFAVMPSLSFSGTWTPADSGRFISDTLNFKNQDESDPDVGVSIDPNQFNAAYKYQNPLNKTMRYSLTIQRSTGRFSETYQEEPKEVPFKTGTGRCVFHKAE